MFSSLRLRSFKQQQQPNNNNKQETNNNNNNNTDEGQHQSKQQQNRCGGAKKSTSKWSIDRALCPGPREKCTKGQQDGQDEIRPANTNSQLQQQQQQPWNQTQHYTGGEEDDTGCAATTRRVVGVGLERDSCGLGVTLRGGPPGEPLVITHIKYNGPAHREGTIKVGDRLLAVDGRALSGCGLSEAQELLKGAEGTTAWLTVEYDVSVMSRLRRSGPLLVEIDSAEAAAPEAVHLHLGLGLIESTDGRVIVSTVKTASIAERCGALLPGDQILGVNEWRVEGSNMSASQVNRLISTAAKHSPLLQIEILPVPSTRGGGARPRECPPSPTLSGASSVATMSQQGRQHNNNNNNTTASCVNLRPAIESSPLTPTSSSYSPDVPSMIANIIPDNRSEVRVETGVVTLQKTPGLVYGVTLRWVPSKMAAVICDVEPNGLADRSGVVQIGDRVTSMSAGGGLERVTSLDELPGRPDSVVLTLQFDVDCPPPVLPTLPTVAVTLTRSPASGFGITINGCSEYSSSIVISHIRWGSVAHRSGRLSVGDALLAIDDTHIGGDIHLATRILHRCGRHVTFLVVKHSYNMGYSSPGLPSVDSAVESWDSCEQNAITSNAVQPTQHYGREDDEETGGGPWISADGQQSDNETCSSYRLSEGVAYSQQQQQLQVRRRQRHHQAPPCPLQTDYKLRNNMAGHWRGSSINNSNAFNNLETLEAELSASVRDCRQLTFRTFRGSHHLNTGSPQDQQQQQQCAYSGQQYSPVPVVREPEHQQYAPGEHQFGENIFKVTLLKDPVYEDFGFSVSDGLYERGVFINRIRPGGPAHLSRMLHPFDRIIQVNDTKTDDFDCCLTVPLVASAGNRLMLTVLRYRPTVQVELHQTNGDCLEESGWAVEELAQEVTEASLQEQEHHHHQVQQHHHQAQLQHHPVQQHHHQAQQPPQQVAVLHNTL